MQFFEETNPQLPRYGSFASEKDNPAEWIVDITTQVLCPRFPPPWARRSASPAAVP